MEYRSILVHLDESERARTRLDLALHVAQRHGALVSALFAPGVLVHDADRLFAFDTEYWTRRQRDTEEQRRTLEHYFSSRLSEANLNGKWRTVAGNAQHELLMHARFADLIVLGQSDPNDPHASLGNRFQARVTLSAGRPVLWVPHVGAFPTVGERVAVAWDAGQSATRALFDALPFMRLAKQTEIVTFTPVYKDRDRVPGADIGLVLARHGIDVKVTPLHPLPMDSVGDGLLSRVENTGSDLLVMGAYGHARWKELVLGGVTQTVLGGMSMPVLMSH